MYGFGILRGLGIAFKHLIETYRDDIRWLGRRYYNRQALVQRQSAQGRGVFTVQYPEEKLILPENFRYIPFLVYETDGGGKKMHRCTACGICAKVCPPQCIWIIRSHHPKTGRPVPEPAEFSIDIDLCMGCGLCAEYCPFEAIKMDHDFELASYDRMAEHILHMQELSRSVEYYASIRPSYYRLEQKARAEKEAAKKARRRSG